MISGPRPWSATPAHRALCLLLLSRCRSFPVCKRLAAGEGRDQGHTVALVEGVLEVAAALVEDDDAGQFLRHVQLTHERLDGRAVREVQLEYRLAAGRG